MNIISEQEFGELLDEFIREGEFTGKTGNFEEDKSILDKGWERQKSWRTFKTKTYKWMSD